MVPVTRHLRKKGLSGWWCAWAQGITPVRLPFRASGFLVAGGGDYEGAGGWLRLVETQLTEMRIGDEVLELGMRLVTPHLGFPIPERPRLRGVSCRALAWSRLSCAPRTSPGFRMY